MPQSQRSPFGAILREERKSQRISQAELSARIQERFDCDPSVAELGVLSDRAIANIEAPKPSPTQWVRPKHETVQVLMLALGIDPETERGITMLRAADRTRRRESVPAPTQIESNSLPYVHGGREAQWQSLMDAWKLASSGLPQVRLISGTAGAGKTRLIEEFCDKVRTERPETNIAWGECASGAASIEPYLPFRQAISHILKRDQYDPDQTPVDPAHARVLLDSMRKLGGVLIDYNDLKSWMALRAPQHLPEYHRLRESYSPTDTVGRFDQLMTLASAIARDIPLVVVLEDMHWADESSCSLLLYMQRQMRHHTDLPLLIIGSYRPHDLTLGTERHPLSKVINELGRQLESFQLELDTSVGNHSGKAFVHDLVASLGLPARDRTRLTQLLFERTYGHPLFTTELLQRMAATGALRLTTSGEWELNRDEISLDLPDKIRAVMEERFAQLPDNARTVAEAASVQGSSFNVALLPKVTQLSESVVDIALDRDLMQRHHFAQPADDGSAATVYQFQHAAMAEFVYGTLTPRKRTTLHKRTAAAIIEHYGEQRYTSAPIAAWHYQQAGQLVEAAEQTVIASLGAQVKLDHDLTMVWVDRGEQIALQANDVASLWSARIRRAQALRGMGQMQEADRLAHEAIPQARHLKKPELEAQAFDVITLIAYDQGRIVDAIESLNRAIDLYRQTGNQGRVSANLSMLSHSTLRLGRLDMALEYAQQAWDNAPNAEHDGFGAEALLAKGNALMELGQYPQALEEYASSQAIYDATGETRGSVLTRTNSALCMARLGMHDQAQRIFLKLRNEAERLRTPRLLAYILFYQAQSYEGQGDYDTALKTYRSALATRREGGLESMAGDDLAGMVRAAIGLQDQIEMRLTALQNWWRSHDPFALEDPLKAILTFVHAYQEVGDERRMVASLHEGIALFRRRAESIADTETRETYLANQQSGMMLLELGRKVGLAISGFE